MNRQFSKCKVQKANKHSKESSIFSDFTTCKLKLYWAPIATSSPQGRMSFIKKTSNDECWAECGEMGSFITCYGMKISSATVKTYLEVPKKLDTELPCDLAIPLLCAHHRHTCTCVFIAAPSQQTSCVHLGYTKKIWYINIMGFCLAIKNSEMMPFVGKWIQPENTGLSKTGQTGGRQFLLFVDTRVLYRNIKP